MTRPGPEDMIKKFFGMVILGMLFVLIFVFMVLKK